jgi:hypothetical protein
MLIKIKIDLKKYHNNKKTMAVLNYVPEIDGDLIEFVKKYKITHYVMIYKDISTLKYDPAITIALLKLKCYQYSISQDDHVMKAKLFLIDDDRHVAIEHRY